MSSVIQIITKCKVGCHYLQGYFGSSLLCLFLFPISTAFAMSPEACSQIQDKSDRLACYDSITPPVITIEVVETDTEASPILNRKQLESESLLNWFSITPHRPNYILAISHNFSSDYSPYTELGQYFSDTEVKFQISFKTSLLPDLWLGSSIWFAYTQLSFWQLYAEEEASAPFRETNYEPEIMWEFPLNFELLGMNARVFTLALVHQSNGQSEPLSRSWNRISAMLALEKGRYVFSMKPWVRIDGSSNDDNPDIEEYMGRIQLGAAYRGDTNTITVGLKNNLSSPNRSGLEVGLTFPLFEHIKGYAQVYSGYGENLVDQENYTNRVSLGIALTEYL